MSHFYSIQDVLSFAIHLEQASQEFYQQLSQTVHDPSVGRFLRSLIEEEKLHEERLQQMYEGAGDVPEPVISPQEIDGYLRAMKVPDSLEYKEAVKLAMDKEKAAQSLYTIIAGTLSDEILKDVFLQLAAQEKNHCQYFEEEYHKICLGEN
jgi:rubrerythrin